MFWRFAGAFGLAITFAGASGAAADIVCPDSSYCVVTFDQMFTGSYRTGQPKDIVTVSPNTTVETLASNGITIRVYLKNCSGAPLVGIPAEEIVLFDSALCICPGGNVADATTDANGCTTFTRALPAGGCTGRSVGSSDLWVYAEGAFIGATGVKVNSPDNGTTSPCFVDASELGGFVFHLGRPDHYEPCWDWNEDGCTSASDVSYFAAELGANCSN